MSMRKKDGGFELNPGFHTVHLDLVLHATLTCMALPHQGVLGQNATRGLQCMGRGREG
jgi:hypothetical protein